MSETHAAPAPAARKKTQIVVAGGGAGGLELAAKLGKRFGRRGFDIILLEKNRTHIWKPLLHEVATGVLDANLDEVGYRAHGHRWRYRFFWGSLSGIDREKGQVIVAPLLDEEGAEVVGEHRIRYDYLVLATGAVTNDFGTPGARAHCVFLDSQTDADKFRHKLLNECLKVSRAMSADPSCDAHVRVGIVGGGATGVELAAELYNAATALGHYGLEVFDESRLSITLIEAGPRILPVLPEKLSDAARAELEDLGVKVITGGHVSEVTADAILTKEGGVHPCDLKVWAAGVKAPDFMKDIGGLETNRANQLVVRPTLQTTRDDRIFAIGDCAAYTPTGAGRPVPPRAQAAHQMASTAFANIVAMVTGRPLKEFRYHDHGSLVSLSRFSTVGSLMGSLVGGRLAIEGRIARLVYIALYQLHLLAIHGWLAGFGRIVMSQINHVTRPKLKIH